VGARRLRALVREVNRGGTTVVLTTHYMFEAEELVDRLAIVDRGRIVARGSVADIRRAARVGEVLEGPAPGLTEPELDRIRTHPATEGLEVAEHGGRQRVTLRLATGDDRRVQELTELLGSLGAGPIVRRGGTLEDAYVKLVQAGPGASGDPSASVKDGSGTPA
jgi:ABC-2 type transport system ATP-binding protein